MKHSLREIGSGFCSLLTGLRITLREFFRPSVTLQYPHEAVRMPARFRGHIELVRDPETGRAICFACKLCERACPTDCITVEGIKREGEKRKSVSEFKLDFTKCSLCGSCVEACKSNAIRFARDYNLASTRKEDFIMDLFQRLEEEARLADESAPAGESNPAAAPTPEPAEKTAAEKPAAAAGGPEPAARLAEEGK